MGREFIHTFEDWADDYDRSVSGGDLEYQEVFKDYDRILEEVAEHARGSVLEFGVGTGNLTQKLIKRGLDVSGIEPSEKMRQKAIEKIPQLNVSDGDFLDFPIPNHTINTIVSSFAFHHLTDDEKDQAIENYSRLLPFNGRIVFADTLFDSELEKKKVHRWANMNGYTHLLKDLRTEYYPLRGTLYTAFRKHHFVPYFKQLNRFAWLIVAEKKE
ncbi:MAG: class I SAM-dependent methyltransferase [Sporolactobacillus sp.]